MRPTFYLRFPAIEAAGCSRHLIHVTRMLGSHKKTCRPSFHRRFVVVGVGRNPPALSLLLSLFRVHLFLLLYSLMASLFTRTQARVVVIYSLQVLLICQSSQCSFDDSCFPYDSISRRSHQRTPSFANQFVSLTLAMIGGLKRNEPPVVVTSYFSLRDVTVPLRHPRSLLCRIFSPLIPA